MRENYNFERFFSKDKLSNQQIEVCSEEDG